MKNKFALSSVGERMSSLTGVRAIMKDIIETLQSGSDDFINLSAGNPVILPRIATMWAELGRKVLAHGSYSEIIGRYGSSRGYQPLIDAIVHDFNQRLGLSLSEKNVVITPGSQTIFFLGSNSFAGYDSSGKLKKMVIPLVPEYTGYGGITLEAKAVTAFRPIIEINGAHSFKYKLDRENFALSSDSGCIVASRPCNPTGNILTHEEMLFLTEQAKRQNVPFFVDGAYASPYPGLNFEPCDPIIEDHVVNCYTLSKAGLPGERLGFAIGDESVIEILQSFLTNACIHSSRFGQAIAAEAIASKQLQQLCAEEVGPFYKHKFEITFNAMQEHFPEDLPWYVHQGEGGIFIWLWLQDLPISDWEFYQELKKEKVIAVPGSTFFPGLETPWKHAKECIRISLTATDEELTEAMRRIGKSMRSTYSS